MKAVFYRRYGGPEVLEYTDVPDPKLTERSFNKEQVDESGRYERYWGA